jgi:hypothetical protein
MIKVIVKFDTPLADDDSVINNSRKQLFLKYRTSGKIITDFVYISDTIIELRFNTLESAQAFEQETKTLNDGITTFEYPE